MLQATSHTPSTAGIPSSRLGHSRWVLWWNKRVWVSFSRDFPVFPSTNFIPSFLHTHLIHFISFHPALWWCNRRGRPALSHLIPRPSSVSDKSWGYLFILFNNNFYCCYFIIWARWLKEQVTWLWAGRHGFDPGRGRIKIFSRLCVHIGPGAHLASCKMSNRVFLGVKKAECRASPQPIPIAVVANMWILASTSLMGLHGL